MENNEKMKTLYELSKKSKGASGPKKSLFGIKCPKCRAKLQMKSEKCNIVPAEAHDEFTKQVSADFKLTKGGHTLTIEYYECKCDYSYAKASVEQLVARTMDL